MSDLADRFRREGLADAVVLLVAKRMHPQTTAEDWGRALGLQQHEVRAAIARFRANGVLPEGCERPPAPTRGGRRGHTFDRSMLRPVPPLAEVRPIGWRAERDAEIRRMHDEGLSNVRIGHYFGITGERVGQILQRASA